MVHIGLSQLFTWDLVVLVLLSLIGCPRTCLIIPLLLVLIYCCWLFKRFLVVFICFSLFSKHLYLFPWPFTSLLYYNLFVTFQFIRLSVWLLVLLILCLLFILIINWLLLFHIPLKVFILYLVVSEITAFILHGCIRGFIVVVCSTSW